ncbi:MAG: hypothetical protein QXZ60_03705 [Sulfolobales archaeon]
MDVKTLYRNLESNVLRRDAISKKLKKSCCKPLKDEDVTKILDQVKLLRTSRKSLTRILSKLREYESFEGFEEPLTTIIEYMYVVGVHVEKEILLSVAELLRKHENTKSYADEILNIDIVEIEKLSEDLRATYAVIRERLKT